MYGISSKWSVVRSERQECRPTHSRKKSGKNGRRPSGLAPFQRIGDDVFIIWDADDPQTDIYMQAGVTVCRALCSRQAKEREGIERQVVTLRELVDDLKASLPSGQETP